MLVGLKWFSIIWVSVLGSTLGNKYSIDLGIADSVPLPNPVTGRLRPYVPGPLAAAVSPCSCSLSSLSLVSWFCNSAIQ